MGKIEDNIERLGKSVNAYEAAEPDVSAGFGKKTIRRLENVNESLENFGANQNEFNKASAEAVEGLTAYCRRLEGILETEREACRKTASALASLKKEFDAVKLRSTLNSNQIGKFDKALVRSSERTENFILDTNPGFRHSMRPKGCREADFVINRGFYEKAEKIKNSPEHERKSYIAEFEKYCQREASKDFLSLDAYDEICISFIGEGAVSEILLENLNRRSIYKIIRNNGGQAEGKFFVCCSDTLSFPDEFSFISGITVICGDAPLSGMSGNDIENLLFLNDCGLHEYITLSLGAYETLVKAGFRNIRYADADFLSGTGMISLVESAVECAVPYGAVSFDLFCEKAVRYGKKAIMSFEELIKFNEENSQLEIDSPYPENCLKAFERGVISAVCLSRFPGESIRKGSIASDENQKFDLITGFGYVNHLKYASRRKVYEKAKRMLSEDGVFVFSASDARTGIKLRALSDWNGYELYEALWTRKQLIRELEENGFRLSYLIPAGAGIYSGLPEKYSSEPVIWIAGVSLK